MYRTNAYQQEPSTPTTKKLTKEQLAGAGLFLLLKGCMVALIGLIIHAMMVPNAIIFIIMGCAEIGIGCLILGTLVLIFLAKVVMGKETL